MFFAVGAGATAGFGMTAAFFPPSWAQAVVASLFLACAVSAMIIGIRRLGRRPGSGRVLGRYGVAAAGVCSTAAGIWLARSSDFACLLTPAFLVGTVAAWLWASDGLVRHARRCAVEDALADQPSTSQPKCERQ
ncbi:MAG: hypothetical protein AB1716_10355 [Planctomycetota bacterium]